MCGICGIWGQAGRESVESMVKAMQHRGPDDSGVYSDDSVTLGMTRLSIIDLSETAHQPMGNQDKTVWIVYNGETYNFQSERRLLEGKGYEFRSRSDTEVVLRLYEHFGDDFLLRLRGMFALAIYDRRRGPGQERLLLARDQLGIKPLLFARLGSRFVFASEMKAILASGLVTPEVDPVALRLLLTYGSLYQSRTMIQGVGMIPPAHRVIIESNRERIERYWSFSINRRSGLRTKPYAELVDEVADAIEESVRLQLVSDVPIGAFLSGGVDSSLLVGLMTRVAGHRIKTFSVGFEDEGSDLDETDQAEITARFLGADHTRVLVRGSDVRDRIQHIARSLDQPSVDGVNSYFVSMAAQQTVTVAISGTGGDEVFAGYPWFTQMALYERKLAEYPWKTAAKAFLGRIAGLSFFDSMVLGRMGKTIEALRNNGGFVGRYSNTYKIFGALGAGRLISPHLRQAAGVGRAQACDLRAIDELQGGAPVERVSALCLRGYTNNQLLRDIDAVSMAHSLEVRVPFLDVPLIDLSLSLPESSKLGQVDGIANPHLATYRESGCKKILIDAGLKRKLLPEGIDLQPKRGFTMPFYDWLRGPLQDVLDDTLSAHSTRARGFFEVDEVKRVKQDFKTGKTDWCYPWLLMMVELWCRELLDV